MDPSSQRYLLSISVKLIISIGAALAATLIPKGVIPGLVIAMALAIQEPLIRRTVYATIQAVKQSCRRIAPA